MSHCPTTAVGCQRRRGSNARIYFITACIALQRLPSCCCCSLLLAVFPRGEKGSAIRAQVEQVNKGITKLGDQEMVTYLDIGSSFLNSDGVLPKDIMPDLLHPNERGYQIWAEAIEGTLSQLLD